MEEKQKWMKNAWKNALKIHLIFDEIAKCYFVFACHCWGLKVPSLHVARWEINLRKSFHKKNFS